MFRRGWQWLRQKFSLTPPEWKAYTMQYEHVFIFYRQATGSRIVITVETEFAGSNPPVSPVGFTFVSAISNFVGIKE